MDQTRHLLPSHYSLPPRNHPTSRYRQPLLNTAGNLQPHGLPSVEVYNEYKGHRAPASQNRSMYSMPTLPSQPLPLHRQPLLGVQRRQSHRRRKQERPVRNPIVESQQYQAYRARQNREGNNEDSKWPEKLEEAFLDALIMIPVMGRRKWTHKGKPHGRNELIKEYLWIAYCNSLAPGEVPDITMERSRKQVSSHIQVLKGFLRDHPAFDRLFPPNKGPKNGFEDSFKNDPTLIALSQGKLPSKNDQSENYNQLAANHPMSPSIFWALMSPMEGPGAEYRRKPETHEYTRLAAQAPRASLESLVNWRHRYPYLALLYSNGEINCDIIHMDACLDMDKTSHDTDGAQLSTRQDVSIPGEAFAKCAWQCVTSVIKPQELYRDPSEDPPIQAKIQTMPILGTSNTSDTGLRVPFPVNTFAQAFASLAQIDLQNQDRGNSQPFGGEHTKSVREYVDGISMYQELQSSAALGMPFIRRAVIVWSFRKMRPNESNGTTWRYLDPPPSRHACMSPTPSNNGYASIHDNFQSPWSDTQLNLLPQDPFTQDLASPPLTGGLHSSFPAATYPYPTQPYDLSTENNMSFVSHDSSSALVAHDHSATQLENLLHSSHAADLSFDDTSLMNNTTTADYEHTSQNWQANEPFGADPAWETYPVQSNNWGTPSAKQEQTWPEPPKQHNPSWPNTAVSPAKPWPEMTATPPKPRTHTWPSTLAQLNHKPAGSWLPSHTFPSPHHESPPFEAPQPHSQKVIHSQPQWIETPVDKVVHWDDSHSTKHGWADNIPIAPEDPAPPSASTFVEHSIEQKLLSWGERHREEARGTLLSIEEERREEEPLERRSGWEGIGERGLVDERKDSEWEETRELEHVSEDYGFEALTAAVKSES